MSLALVVVLWVCGVVTIGTRTADPGQELITGYDPTVHDSAGLAAFVGRWTVVLRIAPVASGFVPERYWDEDFGVAFVVLTVALSSGMILGAPVPVS